MKITNIVKSSIVLFSFIMSFNAVAENYYDVSQFDLFGIKLGMPPEEVRTILKSKYDFDMPAIPSSSNGYCQSSMALQLPNVGEVNVSFNVDTDRPSENCEKGVKVSSIIYSFWSIMAQQGKDILTNADKESIYQSIIVKYGEPSISGSSYGGRSSDLYWRGEKDKGQDVRKSDYLLQYFIGPQRLILSSKSISEEPYRRRKEVEATKRKVQEEYDRTHAIKPQL
ncbi:hypothetical protein [Lonepinella sp. MS14435]|uniref:hypothetical protein n=1 Tax=Lonepinella sp. MS14435 TaxID=3003618 RepID=UPI0036DACEC6